MIYAGQHYELEWFITEKNNLKGMYLKYLQEHEMWEIDWNDELINDTSYWDKATPKQIRTLIKLLWDQPEGL